MLINTLRHPQHCMQVLEVVVASVNSCTHKSAMERFDAILVSLKTQLWLNIFPKSIFFLATMLVQLEQHGCHVTYTLF